MENPQAAFPLDLTYKRSTEFSFPNRWRARKPALQHTKYSYNMAHSIPADPELDLTGLLDSVPDLAKKAIAGGLFLGDIDDIADSYDVSSAVDDLANQKFSVLRSLSKTLGATQWASPITYWGKSSSRVVD